MDTKFGKTSKLKSSIIRILTRTMHLVIIIVIWYNLNISRLNKSYIFLILRCVKYGGQQALDNWLKEQESLIFAVMENFEVTKIQKEIENKKATGDLDLVFKKYCG